MRCQIQRWDFEGTFLRFMANKTQRWKELCALAAVEQDPQRLLELVREINRLLDAEGDQKDDPKAGKIGDWPTG